jgi:hypothetical protein
MSALALVRCLPAPVVRRGPRPWCIHLDCSCKVQAVVWASSCGARRRGQREAGARNQGLWVGPKRGSMACPACSLGELPAARSAGMHAKMQPQ